MTTASAGLSVPAIILPMSNCVRLRYTSVLVGMSNGAEYSKAGYGGTSVSSPEFAAIQSDVKQARHHSAGFGEDTSLNAVRGFDNATGVGTPTLSCLRARRQAARRPPVRMKDRGARWWPCLGDRFR